MRTCVSGVCLELLELMNVRFIVDIMSVCMLFVFFYVCVISSAVHYVYALLYINNLSVILYLFMHLIVYFTGSVICLPLYYDSIESQNGSQCSAGYP